MFVLCCHLLGYKRALINKDINIFLGLFTNINASWPGSCHDAHIFKTSAIGIHLQNDYRDL